MLGPLLPGQFCLPLAVRVLRLPTPTRPAAPSTQSSQSRTPSPRSPAPASPVSGLFHHRAEAGPPGSLASSAWVPGGRTLAAPPSRPISSFSLGVFLGFPSVSGLGVAPASTIALSSLILQAPSPGGLCLVLSISVPLERRHSLWELSKVMRTAETGSALPCGLAVEREHHHQYSYFPNSLIQRRGEKGASLSTLVKPGGLRMSGGDSFFLWPLPWALGGVWLLLL